MLLRSIHHVLHINRSLAVRSLWQSLQDPSPGGKSSPSFFNKHSHTDTHTQNKHTHPHKLILSILNVYDNEIFSIILCLAPYSCPLSLLFLPPFLSLSLSLSRLDVVEWVKAARLRRSTSHAQPSVQRVLGGRVQRVVLRERQHHCISLWKKKTDDF